MNKQILKDITYGMYIVCTKDSQTKAGCVINTLTQITSENPIITISLNKNNYTNQLIKKTNQFSLSILSELTDPNTISIFGFQSSQNTNKFQNVKYQEINNLPIIDDNTTGYLLCEVLNIIDLETHDLFIARVKSASKENNLPPMTYKYYHEVIKGTAPKQAPTYQEEITTSQEEIWICDTCGYVHKGPLPENYICPICKQDQTHFQKKS